VLSRHPVLVTGAAGFIGAAVSEALLARGERVVGLDNLNDYYDPGFGGRHRTGWRDPSGRPGRRAPGVRVEQLGVRRHPAAALL
jgi:nucleoside-diphosphate-sugar epimerase